MEKRENEIHQKIEDFREIEDCEELGSRNTIGTETDKIDDHGEHASKIRDSRKQITRQKKRYKHFQSTAGRGMREEDALT